MTVIAEIGTAHQGSLSKAKELIDAACEAGADAVKFQWVYADEILHPETGFVSLPGGSVRLYDRFKALEVSPQFFADCASYAHQRGALFICSPFGIRSLQELLAIKPDAVKIASPEINHIPLLRALAASRLEQAQGVPVIISSGVSTLSDIETALRILRTGAERTAGTGEKSTDTASAGSIHAPDGAATRADSTHTAGAGANSIRTVGAPDSELSAGAGTKLPPLTLLHCITSYPAPESEYNVRLLSTLHAIFGVATGISDHSLDPVLVPVLSCAMGGTMIEKHITLSKKTDGLDDPVALEPEQFAYLCFCVRQCMAAFRQYGEEGGRRTIIAQMEEQYGKEKVQVVLGDGVKRLAKSEQENYGRTNRSLHFMRALKQGDTLHKADIGVLRTEKVLTPGISPLFLDAVIGARLTHDVASGEGVQWTQLITQGK